MFRSYRDTVITSIKVNSVTLKKYYCDLCPVDSERTAWPSETDVEIHRRKVHKEELIELLKDARNLICTICLRTQPDKPTLIAHIKTDHLLTPATSSIVKHEIFICDYCTNIFFNKLLLITHMEFYHTRNLWVRKNETVVCPYCFKTVPTKSLWFHYMYHGILHTGTCPICVTTFRETKEVLNHVDSHRGCYSCCFCSYETKKGDLFTNHMKRHKKTVSLEGKSDVNKVMKYYLPKKIVSAWNRKVLNVFRGIPLATEIQICVLCRTMCETDEQMLQHIYGDHSPDNTNEIKRHLCVCGEEFFNGVLLKHHIFTLKGEHKVYEGTEPPTLKQLSEVNPDSHQEITPQDDESRITQDDDDVDRIFGIVIEIRESVESDCDQKLIKLGSHSDTEEESDYKIQTDDETQSQFKTEIPQSQKENDESQNEIPQSQKEDDESQNETPQCQKDDDESQNEIPLSQKEDDESQNKIPQSQKEDDESQNEIPQSQKEDDESQNEIPQSQKEDDESENELLESISEMDIEDEQEVNKYTQTEIELQPPKMITTENENEEGILIKNETDQTPNQEIVAQNQNEDDIRTHQVTLSAPAQKQNDIITQNQTIQFKIYNKMNTDARQLIITGKRKSESYKNNAKHFAAAKEPRKETIEVLNYTKIQNYDNLSSNFNQNNVIILNEAAINRNTPEREILRNDNTITEIQNVDDLNKNLNKNKVILLNNIIENTYRGFEIENSVNIHNQNDILHECETSKQYYEAIGKGVIEESRNVDCISESNPETTVYEVVEVHDESSEES